MSPGIKLPLITVITVVFNGEKYLEKSIKSVVTQFYQNIQYIIIDGASTDNTVEIVKKYDKYIDFWVSEKDEGIYDAMNKAINISKGEMIFFLGADDIFSDKFVVDNIVDVYIKNNAKPMMIFGFVKNNFGKRIKSVFGSKLMLHNSLHHQSCFYNAKAFIDFRYDISYKMISDYELNLILYLKNSIYIKIPRLISICQDGGISTNKKNFFNYVSETNSIRGKLVSTPKQILFKLAFIIKSYLHHVIRHF